MLEDFAWSYIALSEAQIQLVSFGFIVMGGIFAALFHRGAAILARAPYFVLSSFVILGISVGQSIWLLATPAMQQGWLSGVIGLELVLSFVAGYVAVVFGQARSRDAFGHSRGGILSLVPLANLALIFAPAQDPARPDPSIALARGGLGVVVGRYT